MQIDIVWIIILIVGGLAAGLGFQFLRDRRGR